MNQIEVLISSCDKYSKVWPACCHGLKKYWPDRDWPVTFMSNYKEPPCGTACKVGTDVSWSDNLLLALEQVGSSVVLFIVEDIWLTKPVVTEKLQDYAEILIQNEASHIRLFPPKKFSSLASFADDDSLYIFSNEEPYRVSTHAGLWRVNTLQKLLQRGESIWDFELNGSVRSCDLMMLCVKDFEVFQYVNQNYGGWHNEPVRRGRWTSAAVKYIKREGLNFGPTIKANATVYH